MLQQLTFELLPLARKPLYTDSCQRNIKPLLLLFVTILSPNSGGPPERIRKRGGLKEIPVICRLNGRFAEQSS
jgi:hypothetical protein